MSRLGNDIIQFQVENAVRSSKTSAPFKRDLFVVNMLEWHSLSMKNMSKISDENGLDIRSNISCEIFDQFIDKWFKKREI